MPTLILVDRERGLVRDRPRLNWPGNYITIRRWNKVWFIPYNRVEIHYVKYYPYRHPYSLPFGYVFAPVLEPRPRPLQPLTSPEAVYQPPPIPEPFDPRPPGVARPPTIPQMPPAPPAPPAPAGPPTLPTIPVIPIPIPPTPPTLPSGVTGPTLTIPVPATDFMADYVEVSTTMRRVSDTSIPVRSVALIAHINNTDDIVFLSRKSGRAGGRLPPGAGIILEIDDPSKILVVARSGTQGLTVAWELAKYSSAA